MAPSPFLFPSSLFDGGDVLFDGDILGGYGYDFLPATYDTLPAPAGDGAFGPLPAPVNVPAEDPGRGFNLPLPSLPAPILDQRVPAIAQQDAFRIRRETHQPSHADTDSLAPVPTGVSKGRKRKNPEITQRERKTLDRGKKNMASGKGPTTKQQEVLDRYAHFQVRRPQASFTGPHPFVFPPPSLPRLPPLAPLAPSAPVAPAAPLIPLAPLAPLAPPAPQDDPLPDIPPPAFLDAATFPMWDDLIYEYERSCAAGTPEATSPDAE